MTYTEALQIINLTVNNACNGITPSVSEVSTIQQALTIVNDGPGTVPPQQGPKH